MNGGPIMRPDPKPGAQLAFPYNPIAQQIGPLQSRSAGVEEQPLWQYFLTMFKHKWSMALAFVAIVLPTTVASMKMTPEYDASARILINRSESSMSFGGKDGAVFNYEPDDPTELETQIKVLQSDSLALDVVQSLHLDQNPGFGGLPGAKPSDALSGTPAGLNSARASALISRFRSDLKISRVPDSRVIEIRFSSTDPKLATEIANALTQAYIQQNIMSRYDATVQATEFLSKQLTDLQMKIETSQEKLVRYQKEKNIFGIDEKQNIITSKLDELNRTVTSAEADRIQKEALYRLSNSDRGAAAGLQADIKGSTAGGGDTMLTKLRSQESDLQIQLVQLSTKFGPSYPGVIELKNQLTRMQESINLELRRNGDQIRASYLTALQRENMLRAVFEKQKLEANQLNESAIQYNLLKRDVDSNRQIYEGLLQKLKEAGVAAGLKSSNIRVIDAARVPASPARPSIPRNIFFASILGLISAVGAAVLLESLDNTVNTPELSEVITGLPTLAIIPFKRSLATKRHSALRSKAVGTSPSTALTLGSRQYWQSDVIEAFRALRTSLMFTTAGAELRVVLITSAAPQDGKTSSAANTAMVLAQRGARVLLVDADLRRPRLHSHFGVSNASGLTTYLTGNAADIDSLTISPVPELPTFSLLPAGPQAVNPAELLGSAQMFAVVSHWREKYDYIVIDSPPALAMTDPVILSRYADAVLLVVRAGHTRKQALRRVRELFAQVNARAVGVILNAVDLSSPDYYDHYARYGNDGYSTYYEKDRSAR